MTEFILLKFHFGTYDQVSLEISVSYWKGDIIT